MLLPQTKSAAKCVGVRAETDPGGQCVELLGISSAHDDLLDLERGLEPLDDVGDMTAPFLFAEPFEPGAAHVLFVRASLFIGQMRELQRLEHAIDDQRRPEAGSETEK